MRQLGVEGYRIDPQARRLLSPSGEPVAMTADDIADIVTGFGRAARVCRDGGFTGIQVHAAHGYLLHEFLSPLANQRTDAYGGSFEKRIRFVIEVFSAMRAASC